MHYQDAVFLGLVQGLSEFLPISSSGHLALFQAIFGQHHDLTFELLVHLATLFSVFTVMHKPIRQIIHALVLDLKNKCYGQGMNITAKIFVGCLPAGLVGLLFKETLSSFFSSMMVVSSGFFFTGLLLLIATQKTSYKTFDIKNEPLSDLRQISYQQALIIGCFQALALIPGISRSGSTIAGGLLLRLTPDTATYFSFFLAIPTIIGAVILQLSLETSPLPISILSIGFVSAYIIGVGSLWWIFKIVQKGHLKYFAFYLLFLAIALFTKELMSV